MPDDSLSDEDERAVQLMVGRIVGKGPPPTEAELNCFFWQRIMECLKEGFPVLGAHSCAMRWPGLFQ